MSEVKIHPTAIVEKGAELDTNVEVGPYSVIGPHVKIGKNTKIHSHVVVEGHTTLGESNQIYPFSMIGAPPQDKSYKNEPTQLIVGDHNLFREGVTLHRATLKENLVTKIGSHGYYMAQVHIAHDCVIGDYVTLANATMCAGHVHVGDYVQMGGACGVTPFVKVGRGAFIGAASAIDKDIPPFCTAFGNRTKLKGVNIIGLKRRGFSKDEISLFVDFYRLMESSALSSKSFIEHPENLEEYKDSELVMETVNFIKASEVGISMFMS